MPKSVPTIPTDTLERTLWVQGQLRLRGLSFARIADEHGWHRNAVAMAMRVPSYPQEVAIADALEIPVQRLFPERYRRGRRIHRVLAERGAA